MTFNFTEHTVGYQSPEQTLLIITYELGKLIEYNHKAKIYGTKGANSYYSDANQQKEMSDLISMSRYYCEQKSWNFDELIKLGEEAFLERMDDIRRYGVNPNGNNKEVTK